MKLYGAIDIGTNTVLSLAGYMDKDNLRVIVDNRHHYRAGVRYDSDGNLSAEYKQRLRSALRIALSELADCGTDLRIVATEVLRRAKDGDAFALSLSSEFGVKVEIISPAKEAALGFLGATNAVDAGDGLNAVIDVGGGSTELAIGIGKKMRDWRSIGLGAVALAEEIGYEMPPDRYLERAGSLFESSDFRRLLAGGSISVYAIGGSAVTLALYSAGFKVFPDTWPKGLRLEAGGLKRCLIELSSMTIDKRREAIPFDTPRADIIVPGGAILSSFMKSFGVDSMMVSPGGLRHGLLLEQIGRLSA